MADLIVFVPPVLSALLGAVAIRSVEVISAKRSGYTAIHNELLENYWRLEGEIQDVQRGDWREEYTREVRLDSITAVKAHSPGIYIEIVNEVEGFVAALASMENIRREQVESRRPGARVTDEEEEIVRRLQEVQDTIDVAESSLRSYSSQHIFRRLLLYGTTPDDEIDENPNDEVLDKIRGIGWKSD